MITEDDILGMSFRSYYHMKRGDLSEKRERAYQVEYDSGGRRRIYTRCPNCWRIRDSTGHDVNWVFIGKKTFGMPGACIACSCGGHPFVVFDDWDVPPPSWLPRFYKHLQEGVGANIPMVTLTEKDTLSAFVYSGHHHARMVRAAYLFPQKPFMKLSIEGAYHDYISRRAALYEMLQYLTLKKEAKKPKKEVRIATQ